MLEKAPTESPPPFTLLAVQMEGYSATDLYNLVTRAMHQAAMRSTTPKHVDADAAVRTLCQTWVWQTTQDIRRRSTCKIERVNRAKSEQVDGIGSSRMA
ncbi:hypothetical protein FIBSPDRAFT_329734 [Athelia psychrophila]|uniref:Uncharacterized protein n=1 Tax=Athelia psychrophila TaxID=1759441 RepID=A0A167WJH0_9AGAM|nr:hypothetical protein FIBSPDRAFT_329734 [Fibularhizoctonia sp. CBS 109695]